MILFFSFVFFFFSLLIPEAAKSGDFRAAERRDALNVSSSYSLIPLKLAPLYA